MNNLTLQNWQIFAMKAYENPQCLSVAEYIEDVRRFKYVKRLCRRYLTTGVLSERLMLNHLVLLTNVFGPVATVRLLFLKCADDVRVLCVLKPFLMYLTVLPAVVENIAGTDYHVDAIPMDRALWQLLQDC